MFIRNEFNVHETLDEEYPQKWIGRGGSVNCPLRSPDLTYMGICTDYLWRRSCINQKTQRFREHDVMSQGCCSINKWRRGFKGCRKLQFQSRTLENDITFQTSVSKVSRLRPSNEKENLRNISFKRDVKLNSDSEKDELDKDGGEDVEYKYKSGLLGLFRYATCIDILLLITGIIFSIIHGASFPILAVVFGQMTNAFIHEAVRLQNASIEHENHEKEPLFTDTANPLTDVLYLLGTNIGGLSYSTLAHNRSSEPAGDESQFTSYLAYYSYNYLYIGALVLVAAFIQTLCWELSCERQVYKLRIKAFTQIVRQDITWYDTRQQRNLSNILSDDIERIREGIGCKFSMVVQYMSTFMFGTVVGLMVNWRLTAALLLVAPLLIGASAYLAKLTAGSAAREQLKYAVAGSVAEEVLSNQRTVAAFSTEQQEVVRFEKALEVGLKLAMHKYIVLAWGLVIVFFLMYAQYGLAFYYGANLIEEGYCTPGSVFTVFFSVLSGAFILGNALPYVNAVATALGSASSVFSVVDRKPHIDSYSNSGLKPMLVQGHIRFRNVHFSYPSRPDVPVLRGIDLDIQPGTKVALVGHSGSGKSTIFQLLLRFYEASSGEVSLDGKPLPELNLAWLRNRLGVVFQEPVLFGVTIAENIRYGREGVSQDEVELAATMANIHAFIDGLPEGYTTLVGEHGTQLSGGQKQRIALARALVHDPAILLLDEATSALDAESESVVQDALERAMLGRTTVIIAHRLSTVRNADAIMTLHEGRVVEQGTHEELMAMRGVYFQLASTQAAFQDEVTSDRDTDSDTTEIPQPRQMTSELSLYFPEKPLPEGEGRSISLWTLIRYNRPECVWLLLGLLGCSMTGSIMPVFAFFYGEVFATFTLQGQEMMEAAIFWSCMFLLLGVLAAASIWLEIVTMTLAVERLVMRLRVMAFHNILRQSVGWFDSARHSSGHLISRLARDAPLIKGAAGLRLGQMLSAMVTLVAAISIAFVFGWKLALVLLLIVPLITGGAYHQTLMMRRTQTQDSRLMDDANKIATECVQNITTVQALCAERRFLSLYANYLNVPFRNAMRQAVIYSVIYALSQAVIYIMYAGAFRFGAYLIEIGDMTPSDVYRVFFALAFCAASVGTSSAYVQDYNKAKVAARQMFYLIDRDSEIDALSPHGLTPAIRGMVSFNQVYFHYPSRPDVQVYRGLTLRVEAGQTVAVVGQSGSGKSTLVCLLERFYNPTSGTITVDGVNIEDINVQHLRQQIGLVTQEPMLFNRTIRDNIAYGLTDDTNLMARVVEAATVANCHEFISQLPQGYDTRVGESGSQLSGGQKQRIAIARALVRDPAILLLDEATSALDTENEKLVQEALDKARRGRTCIIIAHRLSTIHDADLIAVLDRGKVRELGTHQQLLSSRGLYYRLMKAQHL
ncbi:ATP-dependent translocase ABCB1-like isoform X2 [Homalodisca vitripennis]|uniref:ATP-dependent translocase ABCB1-like isoform X2 n=1 Tax=Homalodisca vitripennis TaxID=197043 RepID=UPI001EEA38A8|nr:ATP-dependent translocase ABCB1-like isoform X2 [Homalodisca vitripennis]